MKTIDVSRRSKALNELLREARNHDLIIRSPEGREFVLAEISDFDREVETSSKNKSLMRFLARARPGKRIPLAEVKKRLGL